MTNVLIRETDKTQTHRGSQVKAQGDVALSQEQPQPPGAGRGKDGFVPTALLSNL